MQLQFFFPELILHRYSVGGYTRTEPPKQSHGSSFVPLSHQVQQSGFHWIPSRLEAVDMGSRRDTFRDARCSWDSHTRKVNNFFRNHCDGESAPILGFDQREHGQGLREAGLDVILQGCACSHPAGIYREFEANAVFRISC